MLNINRDSAEFSWTSLIEEVRGIDTLLLKGKVFSIEGDLIRAKFITPEIGVECRIGAHEIPCEVISVTDSECLLVAYENVEAIKINDDVIVLPQVGVDVCTSLLGRVVDGLGRGIDGLDKIQCSAKYPLHAKSLPILNRPLIQEQLYTNIKVIDMFAPIGKGQRVGIFSGTGVGKSTLLGMIAHHSLSDVNVVALIGERGREVKELIEYDITKEGMKNTVVVVASSEESPLIRLRAVYYACAIAEYFRDQGYDVSLLVDSLTRIAHAQRETGMMRGEVPVARGFPTSLYRVLPQIVERCGTSWKGSITGIFTVLVEGEDEDEPVTDIVKGIVDGHLVLKRDLAQQMHYPAIHIASSISRVANRIQDPKLNHAISIIRERLGMYEQAKDIINAGVYSPGSNRSLDVFLNVKPEFDNIVKQSIEEKIEIDEVKKFMLDFVARL